MGQGGSGALTPCPRCCLGLVHWGGGAVPSPAVTPRSSCLWPVRLTALRLALNPGSVPFLFLERS